MRTTVSKNFRIFILGKYPALVGNDPFLRLFRYLCFGTFHDGDTHQLVIPAKMMAEEFFEQPRKHFTAQKALEAFRDQVLPSLTWSTPSFRSTNAWHGKARQITNLGFDAETLDALQQECLGPSEDQVDFVTGRAHQREERYRVTAEEKQAYEAELASCTLNGTQTNILNYLRGIHAGRLFLPKLVDNRDAIRSAILQLPEGLQRIRYRVLAAARQNPSVYYLPSKEGRTCRLSPRGDSLVGLKSAVRKAVTKGWMECDLRSSQFAILAAKLKAPISQAFIASGESVWQEFHRHLTGMDTPPPKESKKVLKEAMYSLCFGKSERHLKEFLHEHGMADLLKHPILHELLQLRRKWFQEIEQAGGASDVWGVWHAIDHAVDRETGKERWAGSIAATVIQSVEMEIIAPIFDVATRHGKSDQFGICLFQHDGATLSFTAKDKIDRAQAKLKKAVESRARELGVTTVLEFTQL